MSVQIRSHKIDPGGTLILDLREWSGTAVLRETFETIVDAATRINELFNRDFTPREGFNALAEEIPDKILRILQETIVVQDGVMFSTLAGISRIEGHVGLYTWAQFSNYAPEAIEEEYARDVLDLLLCMAKCYGVPVTEAATMYWNSVASGYEMYPEAWTARIWKAGYVYSPEADWLEGWLAPVVYMLLNTMPITLLSFDKARIKDMLLKAYLYADDDIRVLIKRVADKDTIPDTVAEIIRSL